MNIFLASLLFAAVGVRGDASIPYEYEQSYNTAWHPPVASPKSSDFQSAFSGGLRRQLGGISPGLLMSVAGVSARSI